MISGFQIAGGDVFEQERLDENRSLADYTFWINRILPNLVMCEMASEIVAVTSNGEVCRDQLIDF